MKWVIREHARVDRIACPWLITRFVDAKPEFLFVPANRVREVADRPLWVGNLPANASDFLAWSSSAEWRDEPRVEGKSSR